MGSGVACFFMVQCTLSDSRTHRLLPFSCSPASPAIIEWMEYCLEESVSRVSAMAMPQSATFTAFAL